MAKLFGNDTATVHFQVIEQTASFLYQSCNNVYDECHKSGVKYEGNQRMQQR
jgi:hypothetical protein